uniref:Integrase catalytic domain-containing protein n=1 Tax=Panagrolaimus davidi TaxID=227884 RepID=A0A914PPP0_9BILA
MDLIDLQSKPSTIGTIIKSYGGELIHGKARHSQSQGSIERANRDVQNILTILMRRKNSPHWAELLPEVQLMKNSRYHNGIKKTPYKALFGRDSVYEDDNVEEELKKLEADEESEEEEKKEESNGEEEEKKEESESEEEEKKEESNGEEEEKKEESESEEDESEQQQQHKMREDKIKKARLAVAEALNNILLIFPCAIFVSFALFEIPNSANIGCLMFSIMSCHSLADFFIILSLVAPYRKFLKLKFMEIIHCKKNVSVGVLVVANGRV